MVSWIEVDPEGLVKSSGPYHSAGEEMRLKSAELSQLGYSYWGCWGNDDEGNEFRDTLTDGMDKLSRKIDGTASRINFVASGVEQNGVAYGNAEDAAVTVSQQTYDNNHTGEGNPAERKPPPELLSRNAVHPDGTVAGELKARRPAVSGAEPEQDLLPTTLYRHSPFTPDPNVAEGVPGEVETPLLLPEAKPGYAYGILVRGEMLGGTEQDDGDARP